PGAAFFFSAKLQVVALWLAVRAARGTAVLAEKERSYMSHYPVRSEEIPESNRRVRPESSRQTLLHVYGMDSSSFSGTCFFVWVDHGLVRFSG
ncbi:MAG: hypothetical protein AAGJ31_08065, partial [Verrucomicrobiota bacterium]